MFERPPEGGYRIRGQRTQRWLGWPGAAYDVPKFSAEYLRLAGESARKLGIDRFHVPLAIVLSLLVVESLVSTRKRRFQTGQ